MGLPRRSRAAAKSGTIWAQFPTNRHPADQTASDFLGKLEAPPGFEPGVEVLQTSALPLGDGAYRKLTEKEIETRQQR